MSEKREIKTSRSEIINYWLNSEDYANGDECGMGIDHADIGEDGGRCWRCATTKNVQRCHIVAHSQGGEDHPRNYILLCKDCHDDAPMVSNSTAEDIFNWIKSSRASMLSFFHDNCSNMVCLGLDFKLACYPPKGRRGNFWDLRVAQLAIQNFGTDIVQEKLDLGSLFIKMITEECKHIKEGDIDFYKNVHGVFQDIMQLFDDETEVGIHFPQKEGLTEAKYNSEALANKKSIEYTRNILNQGAEKLKSFVGELLDSEGIDYLNKQLGFDFFHSFELTNQE